MTVVHEDQAFRASSTDEERDADRYFREYSAPLLSYCASRLGSRQDAEDALQAIYLRAWRALQRGSKPRHPAAWLFAVAKNVCHERLDARRRRASFELAQTPDELAALDHSPAPAPGEVEEIRTAVGSLPENQRRALLLREWRGLTYEEIASELRVSHGAVEMLLFRARQAAARALAAGQAPRARARSLGLAILLPLSDATRRSRELLTSVVETKAAATATLAVAVATPAMTIGVLASRDGGTRSVAHPASAAEVGPSSASALTPTSAYIPTFREARRAAGRPAPDRSDLTDRATGQSDGSGSGQAAAQAIDPQATASGDLAEPSTTGSAEHTPPAAGGTGGSEPGATTSPPAEPGNSEPATPAVPATPATPNPGQGPATPATPATPAQPPAHSNGGGQGKPD